MKLLTLLIICIICCSSDAFRRSRFSSRSVRSRSFFRSRISSRSRNFGSDFRTSNYYMQPGLLKRGGGISNKKLALGIGSLYIAHKLRPEFSIRGSYWANGNWDSYNICHGSYQGFDAKNETRRSFKYFICPTEYMLFGPQRKYCCGDLGNQRCCTQREFYIQYGTFTNVVQGGIAVTMIVLGVLAIFGLCTCCLVGVCVYRSASRRQDQARQQQQQQQQMPIFSPVPTEEPNQQFDMKQQQQLPYPMYPPTSSSGGGGGAAVGAGYPESNAPPYSTASAPYPDAPYPTQQHNENLPPPPPYPVT